ncbi:MAG: glycosyltransferase [Ginsengibacter sp.]
MVFFLFSLFLLLLYSGIILFYRQSWMSIREFKSEAHNGAKKPPLISVIIAARNEEKNIATCLKSVSDQLYPPNLFEIILVDDHSTDKTVSIAASLGISNLKILRLEDYVVNKKLNAYKKTAIDAAIVASKGDLVVTTDADCLVKKSWLQTIANFYLLNDPVFIAAPVAYDNPLKSDSFLLQLLKIFQILDFLSLQGITGASVNKQFHNMCNGANLAYTRQAFLEVDGFLGIDDIASGDDMLLMHKIQKRFPGKIAFLKSREAIVRTQPAVSLKEFMNQRIRWASKADRYTDSKITLVLLLVYVFNVWILIVAARSIFLSSYIYLLLLLILIKTAVELIFLFPVAVFFKKQKLLWWFLPAQPFHIMYTVVAGWLGKFGSYNWKGRKTH